ncbi:MAG: hypothetical protein Q27BPR15_01875 [Rhodobacter sp. CACIA14H1]|nr:MAG: hypothetical protein Q27BPR15_01875 [Rhodobacter sp. CACIA14H1]
MTDLAHTSGTRTQDGEKPRGLNRRFKALHGHGKRRIGQGAQLFGQTIQVELFRLGEIHHFALIH